jgi:nucleotide-binding universal stress UspA family protein
MTETTKPYLILVGVDYSTPSEVALERALELAAATPNGEVHVVHVALASDDVSASELPGDDASHHTPDGPLVDTQAEKQLATYVAVSVGAFEKKRSGAATSAVRVVSHLRAHAPAHQIAQLASDLEADLVVVGMHGRGGVSRFFLGSVAESVARLAPCPVLVFRPKGLPPEYPRIEPPCARCVDARFASRGDVFWCEQHRVRHGQRHVYHHAERMSQPTNLPLVYHGMTPD